MIFRASTISLAGLLLQKKNRSHERFSRGANQIWTGDQGVADPCLTTWLLRLIFRTPLLYQGFLLSSRNKILNGSDSYGNRTRVTAVKGRCLNRLTKEPYKAVCFLTALVVYQMYFYLSRVFYIYFYIIFIVIIFILSWRFRLYNAE